MGKLMSTMDRIFWMALFAMVAIFSMQVYAQTVDDLGFFQQVLKYIQDWGGLNWAGKVAGGIFLLTGAMKVTFLDKLWDFMGAFKPVVPLVLSLIAGIVSLAIDPGTDITWAGVMAYVTAGAGSMIIASLLEMVKGIPGIGATTIKIIEFLQIIFRASGPLEGQKVSAKKELRDKMAA